MTPETARIVDPVILTVLDFVDRFEHGQLEHVESECNSVKRLIDKGDQELGGGADVWQLAKYALVSWIDEQYTSLPWQGRDWWTNNPLEYHYFFRNPGAGNEFDTQVFYEKFYIEANRAAALPNKDAIEVYVTCVLLGFRGMYDRPLDPTKSAQIGVPSTQKDWLRNMAGLISSSPSVPFESAPDRGDGARPLDGRLQMITMSFLAILFSVAAALYFYLFVFPGS